MIDSDHHPLIVWMKRGSRNRNSKGRRGKKMYRGVWDEGRKEFKSRLERVKVGEGGLQREIGKMGERIREALKSTEREGGRQERERGMMGWRLCGEEE